MTSVFYRATVTATALLPSTSGGHTPTMRDLTAEGDGDSKQNARSSAESNLREQLNGLRQEFGAGVVLQVINTPSFDEVPRG